MNSIYSELVSEEGLRKNKRRAYAIIPPGMDEWESAIRHLLEHTAKERCPKHLDFLRKYNVHMIAEGLRPASRYRELQILSLFFAFLESKGKSYRNFSYDDYLEFIAFLEERGVKRSLARIVTTIKKLVKYLGKKDLYEKIKTPKRRTEPPEVLSKDEVYKILDSLNDLEYKAMVAVIYEGGLRLKEARMLKLKHVHLNEHGFLLRIEESKSQWRMIQIIEFKDLLAKWLEIHPDRNNSEAWLFPSKWDPRRPVARNVLNMQLHKAAQRAGLKKKVYPHLLRHTRATELYPYFKEKEMMYLFGWRTRAMLDIYSHLKPEQIHEKYLALYGKAEEEKKKPELKIIKCPKCGFENSDIAIFCAHCGRPLREEAVALKVRDEAQREAYIRELEERVRILEKELFKIAQRLEELLV